MLYGKKYRIRNIVKVDNFSFAKFEKYYIMNYEDKKRYRCITFLCYKKVGVLWDLNMMRVQ